MDIDHPPSDFDPVHPTPMKRTASDAKQLNIPASKRPRLMPLPAKLSPTKIFSVAFAKGHAHRQSARLAGKKSQKEALQLQNRLLLAAVISQARNRNSGQAGGSVPNPGTSSEGISPTSAAGPLVGGLTSSKLWTRGSAELNQTRKLRSDKRKKPYDLDTADAGNRTTKYRIIQTRHVLLPVEATPIVDVSVKDVEGAGHCTQISPAHSRRSFSEELANSQEGSDASVSRPQSFSRRSTASSPQLANISSNEVIEQAFSASREIEAAGSYIPPTGKQIGEDRQLASTTTELPWEVNKHRQEIDFPSPQIAAGVPTDVQQIGTTGKTTRIEGELWLLSPISPAIIADVQEEFGGFGNTRMSGITKGGHEFGQYSSYAGATFLAEVGMTSGLPSPVLEPEEIRPRSLQLAAELADGVQEECSEDAMRSWSTTSKAAGDLAYFRAEVDADVREVDEMTGVGARPSLLELDEPQQETPSVQLAAKATDDVEICHEAGVACRTTISEVTGRSAYFGADVDGGVYEEVEVTSGNVQPSMLGFEGIQQEFGNSSLRLAEFASDVRDGIEVGGKGGRTTTNEEALGLDTSYLGAAVDANVREEITATSGGVQPPFLELDEPQQETPSVQLATKVTDDVQVCDEAGAVGRTTISELAGQSAYLVLNVDEEVHEEVEVRSVSGRPSLLGLWQTQQEIRHLPYKYRDDVQAYNEDSTTGGARQNEEAGRLSYQSAEDVHEGVEMTSDTPTPSTMQFNDIQQEIDLSASESGAGFDGNGRMGVERMSTITRITGEIFPSSAQPSAGSMDTLFQYPQASMHAPVDDASPLSPTNFASLFPTLKERVTLRDRLQAQRVERQCHWRAVMKRKAMIKRQIIPSRRLTFSAEPSKALLAAVRLDQAGQSATSTCPAVSDKKELAGIGSNSSSARSPEVRMVEATTPLAASRRVAAGINPVDQRPQGIIHSDFYPAEDTLRSPLRQSCPGPFNAETFIDSTSKVGRLRLGGKTMKPESQRNRKPYYFSSKASAAFKATRYRVIRARSRPFFPERPLSLDCAGPPELAHLSGAVDPTRVPEIRLRRSGESLDRVNEVIDLALPRLPHLGGQLSLAMSHDEEWLGIVDTAPDMEETVVNDSAWLATRHAHQGHPQVIGISRHLYNPENADIEGGCGRRSNLSRSGGLDDLDARGSDHSNEDVQNSYGKRLTVFPDEDGEGENENDEDENNLTSEDEYGDDEDDSRSDGESDEDDEDSNLEGEEDGSDGDLEDFNAEEGSSDEEDNGEDEQMDVDFDLPSRSQSSSAASHISDEGGFSSQNLKNPTILQRAIRQVCGQLLGDMPWKPPSRSRVAVFEKSKDSRDGPSRQKFELQLGGNLRMTYWNKRAADVFASEFTRRMPYSKRKKVEDAFLTHLITLRKKYKEERHPSSPAKKKKAAQRSAADARKRRLFARRREAGTRLFEQDPVVQRMAKEVWTHLTADAMSGDETDTTLEKRPTKKGGNKVKQYMVLRPDWRNPAVEPWLKTHDHLHLWTRFASDDSVTPGRFPHTRISPPMRLAARQGKAPIGLPSNWYSPEWLQRLTSLERSYLKMKAPVELLFSAETLRISVRYSMIVDRNSKPLPCNHPCIKLFSGPAASDEIQIVSPKVVEKIAVGRKPEKTASKARGGKNNRKR